ncbi:MAG: helix-turn-helix transcriptional regulator, partial [Rhizobiales bacterium]|nr:helix-turn-helix transcriptional regulator [Hyphomicrobiales bacterium]
MSDESRPRLTLREREIMALIATGLNSRAIARHLGIAYFTVRKHRSNILPKL